MFEEEYYISFESGYLKIGQTNYLQPTSAIFFSADYEGKLDN